MLTCNWKLAKHVYYLYNSSSILSNYLQWPLRLELSHLNPYLWLVWDWLILKLLDMFRLVQGKTSIFNLKYIICKSPVLTDYVKKQIIDFFCDLIDIFGQLVFHNFFVDQIKLLFWTLLLRTWRLCPTPPRSWGAGCTWPTSRTCRGPRSWSGLCRGQPPGLRWNSPRSRQI